MAKKSNILEQLRSGDNKKAIATLYQSFPMIRKLICNNGGNDADAQDVFQDALLVLYRNAQKMDFELTCAPGTYLYSVARFLWKDTLKKRNKEVSLEYDIRQNEVIENDLELFQQQQSKTARLAAVLQQLGDKCKLLLQAYYYKKMSMKEIAQAFEYSSVNSAKTQKYKCIERAKKIANNQLPSTSKL
ncbi:RNA polymerase sigma factor [Aureispira anguillae]|uniref:Sigma-70 family RNA polymerase sigma factor n=1 Tax=Aureispira anguillae TaxID=2864201 RepID=A0A915YHW7_9BACT|nr:sigma-70 family RNA polymerase sigma factor [Aureispira anguillae]BDS13309.1 sigma-70 family RNA polymerase sigma factor [Aureispira anguillae]